MKKNSGKQKNFDFEIETIYEHGPLSFEVMENGVAVKQNGDVITILSPYKLEQFLLKIDELNMKE